MASSERRSSSTKTSLLGSFRTAVEKVRFLLSLSATRWILSSIVGSRVGASPQRRVSFGPRPPSLLDYEGSVIVSPARSSSGAAPPSRTASLGPSPTRTVSRTSSAASSELLRTSSGGSSSSPGGDDDIDRRAELFIANFYTHIQMERQVSLQLRYLERTPSR
ncbi:hypothetical protein E2562_030629 [Oryza meyeriana var. granulata]|uniref:DUF761 domain-containing protein n=1 Tax=Oryza meyeriana var. granulata TaxID=110450 RepID=A0A6G1CJT1_9ORYZ|nr:hypothetical protein E2562_030629 [Oryza meyeriana var. granulata]